MLIPPFTIAQLPRILFGAGRLAELPVIAGELGRHALLLTGGRSFREGPHWPALQAKLSDAGIQWDTFVVAGEPSPALIDEAVARFRDTGIDLVIAVGGGSVLDAGKAVAALLATGNSVMDHLEDVGRGLPYEGNPLPFIAVPTTAGTGSEATKNAVLSVQGESGYKKSFRHDAMVPDVALVDPELLRDCPRPLMAAQGMDAFTQLLESYVSRRANPFTDALAWSGLEAVAAGFFSALEGGDSEAARAGRAGMAYGALLSGITLAQVGLGAVHGLAQPFGSLFPIPHGVACGSVLATATAVNVQALEARAPEHPALAKYAAVGRLLAARPQAEQRQACALLVESLYQWTERLELPRLSTFGVTEADLPLIVAASRNNSMKSNSIDLSDDEIAAIIRQRL